MCNPRLSLLLFALAASDNAPVDELDQAPFRTLENVLPQLLEALADGNLAPVFNRATKAMSAKQSRIFSSDRRSDFANSDVW